MQDFPDIDILYPLGKDWGQGHFMRMKILAAAAAKKYPQAKVRLCLYKQRFSLLQDFQNNRVSVGENNHPPRILFCDVRELKIEEEITRCYAPVVFLDYAGKQKQEKFFYVNTLPHPTMNIQEYKTALRYFITDIPLYAARTKSGKISLQRKINIKTKYNYNTIYQIPLKTNTKRLRRKEFIGLLQNKKQLVAYFGQSALEGLLLQKDVTLYSISQYHATLSKSFARRWNASGMNLLYLDNRGSERLLNLVEKIWQSQKS